MGVVISDIIPCDGEHIVGGVETLVDQIWPRRIAARRRRSGPAPRVDIGPEWRDDRIALAISNLTRRKCGTWPLESNIAIVVDVQ